MRRVNHLKSKLDFADGKKYLSVLQVGDLGCILHSSSHNGHQQILPYVGNQVPKQYHPFLALIQVLAEVALQAEIKMQTQSRIRCGEESLAKFGTLLPVSIHTLAIHILTLFTVCYCSLPQEKL